MPETTTAKAHKPQKLKEKLPPLHIAVQAIATIIASFIGSFLGVAGTIIGLVIGSVISTAFPVLAEHAAERGSAAARARYQQLRLTRMDPGRARAQVAREQRTRAFRQLTAARAGITAVIVIVTAFAGVTAVEAMAGKPASDIVRGQTGHGLTITGGAPPAPAPSPTLTPRRHRRRSPSATPSLTPSASAPATSSSPAPSSSSPVPVTTSPSPSPPTSSPVLVTSPQPASATVLP